MLLRVSFLLSIWVLILLSWHEADAQLGVVDLGEDKNKQAHVMIRDSTAVLTAATKTLQVLAKIGKIAVRATTSLHQYLIYFYQRFVLGHCW